MQIDASSCHFRAADGPQLSDGDAPTGNSGVSQCVFRHASTLSIDVTGETAYRMPYEMRWHSLVSEA